jgi:hypothetical protein
MSYLGGREDYGFAKTMGRFEPEDGLGERVTIEAYGGNFSPDNRAGWRPFVEIAAASAESGEQRDVPEGPAGLVELLGGGAIDRHDDGDIVLPGLRLARQLVEDMARGRGTQVFLKQFRDSAQGTSACYQSVVEADLQVTRVVPRPSLRDWDVTIHSLDSHPVGRELGVGSQTASMCLDLEMDFVIEQGREIRPQASPAAEQVMLPADPPSGGAGSNGARPAAVVNGAQGLPGLAEELFDLVEGVAGRLRRELSGLRRLRPW